MSRMTRGPLPAGVYWRRRVFVVALAAALGFVVATMLGAGSDGDPEGTPVAQQAGQQVEPSATVTVSPTTGEKKGKKRKKNGQGASLGPSEGPTYDPGVMVEPGGNCDPGDVRITPVVDEAIAGQPVTLGLALQTVQAEACYFRLGPDKISVKILDGSTEVWTSRECPAGVPDDSVVVRRVISTVVEMTWNARESTSDCSPRSDWVREGDYTAVAAALGGEPGEATFDLELPTAETLPADPEDTAEPADDEPETDDGAAEGSGGSDQSAESDDDNEWHSEDAGGAGGDDRPGRR